MAEDNARRTVQSDEKLLQILSAIRQQEVRGITELADELDFAKSTIHSHLATLEDHGFVTRFGEEYHIGLRFLDYGIYSRGQRQIFQAARERVDELAAETGERVWCIAEEHDQAVYLYSAEGEHAVHTHENVGRHTSLHHIAAGKAILAHLPPERVSGILDHTGMEQHTSNTITDRDELERELEEIRDRGVAFNLQESMEGLHAIGAPIKRTGEGVYGAISIGGPAHRLTEDKLENELTDLLLATANEIEINVRHL
ncbi:IclR family transcriptional regulator [Halosimplex amylolyticum]|uniref:IclR family transcriptional regulator n=1 Tax=Halosimplex amylolyticum TaxID=3396616 RepID=UPI003F54EE8D